MNRKDLIINHEISIREAMNLLNETSKKILYFTNEDDVLVGVISDGDIRRWVLKNGSLGESIYRVMNKSPKTLRVNKIKNAQEFLRTNSIESVAIVDGNNRIINIYFWSDIQSSEASRFGSVKSPVIIMAGGKGTRLYPYTKILPKPLIPIGDVPIVERIINKFHSFGCNDIFMTVNFKKSMIKSYFNDIDKEYQIHYIEEDKPLGTAGGLSLMAGKINETFFLSNCDILVDIDYAELFHHHKKSNNMITIVASMKSFVIPYGVLDIDNDEKLIRMDEKPELHYLINTGLYVVEPSVLDRIPSDTFINFTDVIELLKNENAMIGTFLIGEKDWYDMGQIKEMENMIKQFE